jgi:hypothetical protein
MKLIHEPHAAALQAGVARTDITPPVGIYSRMWGAAKHDRAEGVHRPLSATVLALKPTSGDHMILVSLDWVMTADLDVMEQMRAPLERLCGGDPARVIVAHTHTHGIGMMAKGTRDLPGGHLIEPYLDRVCERVAEAAAAAVNQADANPCTLTWESGRCDLAVNRDLPDPASEADRYICGYNPEGKADDTVLVGRITRDQDDRPVATVVNYACHPTTLAWDNRLLSPDYIGAMRQLVEGHTPGLCLFLQGASGELSPANQYSGDHQLADQHGRRLGYAVLSVLESMLPPRQALAFVETVESGAPLAVWRPQPFTPSAKCEALSRAVDLPLKSMPAPAELKAQLERTTERHAQERLRRKMKLAVDVHQVGRNGHYAQPVSVWQLGSILVLATPGEPYSLFQQELRGQFHEHALVVATVANAGLAGYLVPPQLHDLDLYQAWQSPFGAEALPTLQAGCAGLIDQVLRSA